MKSLTFTLLLTCSLAVSSLYAQNEANLWTQNAQNKIKKEKQNHSSINKGYQIHEQALDYYNKDAFDEAIALEEKALTFFREVKKKEYSTYIGNCLYSLAKFYYSRGQARGQRGDYFRAESYAEESLKYEKEGTVKYVDRLNQLSVFHIAAGHVAQANELNKKISKQSKRVYKPNTIEYADFLDTQSFKFASIGNFTDAIDYAQNALSIHEEAGDTMKTSYARLLINTAIYYENREDYQTSIGYLERARAILREIEGEAGTNYIDCIGELSSAYNHLGNLQKADDIAIAIEKVGATTIADALLLRKRADVFYNNGDYKMAANLQKMALAFYSQQGDSLSMGNIYDRLSSCFYHGGNTTQAIEYGQQAIDIYLKYGGKKTDLAQAYNNMSMYHYRIDSIKAALRYSIDALHLYAAAGDTISSSYAKSLTNAALHHYATGNIDKAIEYTLQAYRLQKDMFGEEHPDNVTCLFNTAHYYYMKNDPQKMCNFFHQAMQLQSNIVKENFSHITTEGREKYWDTKKFVFSAAPIYAYLLENQDTLLLDTYNAQLFSKGILLNSEMDFKRVLRQSGSTNLLGKYTEVDNLKMQIANIYNTSSLDEEYHENLQQDVTNLKKNVTILERELMRECKEYGDYTATMNLSAKDIAAALHDGEVAIELFEIEVEGGKAYFAMCLKRGWEVPHLIKLFNYHDLGHLQHNGKDFYSLISEREGIEYLFNEGRVGQMVWNPLIQSWGDDVQNVYFSPSGLFYQWGIEYLMMGDGMRIGDKYNLYRLSSTKLLAQRQEKRPIVNAAIFGGIDYNLPPEMMAEVIEGFNHPEEQESLLDNEEFAMLGATTDLDNTAADNLALRGGSFDLLPGTQIEATMIDAQLLQHGISTDVFTGGEAIEENFTALESKPYSIIHVATHGFSFSEHDQTRKIASDWGILSWTSSASDANLHYSGLLFAGANNVIDSQKRAALPNGKLPNGIKNGILTSYEISKLDLGKVDMVVLSACQTGLGDVKEDGVFGLQRGFKKAGVQTLMMSLWNVNDRATQVMMTDFYKALMEGLSRHEAFKKAQGQMRSEGFTKPYEWASFIMLDDL